MRTVAVFFILIFVTFGTWIPLTTYTDAPVISYIFANIAMFMTASVIWKIDYGTWNFME